MAMLITESPTNLHAVTQQSGFVVNEALVSPSAAYAAAEIAQNYEQHQKTKEKRESIFLDHNPEGTLSRAAQTALDQEETALWLFETAVRKYGQELPADALMFYNTAIELASAGSAKVASAASGDVFAASNNTAGKKNSDLYIDAARREVEAAKIRLETLKMINAFSKVLDGFRTEYAKRANEYKGGDATGTVVELTLLIQQLKAEILKNDGQVGRPGQGIIKDADGNPLTFKDKESAQKYIDEKHGPVLVAEEVLDGNGDPTGEWLVKVDSQPLKDLKALFEKMEATQVSNNKGKGKFLYQNEFSAMDAAIRGIFAGTDGKNTTSSTLASQLQQASDTFNKMVSTLMSNEAEETSRMFSRI